MRTSNKIFRAIAIILLVALTACMCGCNGKLPFMKGEEKTQEELQDEATELSYYLLRRIFIADYDSVRKYVKSDDRDKIESIISKIDTRLYKEADVEIATVYIDPKSHDTEIEYHLTLHFEHTTNSYALQMTMSRSGSSWRLSNALPFFMDMDTINQRFINGKLEDEKNAR